MKPRALCVSITNACRACVRKVVEAGLAQMWNEGDNGDVTLAQAFR